MTAGLSAHDHVQGPCQGTSSRCWELGLLWGMIFFFCILSPWENVNFRILLDRLAIGQNREVYAFSALATRTILSEKADFFLTYLTERIISF